MSACHRHFILILQICLVMSNPSESSGLKSSSINLRRRLQSDYWQKGLPHFVALHHTPLGKMLLPIPSRCSWLSLGFDFIHSHAKHTVLGHWQVSGPFTDHCILHVMWTVSLLNLNIFLLRWQAFGWECSSQSSAEEQSVIPLSPRGENTNIQLCSIGKLNNCVIQIYSVEFVWSNSRLSNSTTNHPIQEYSNLKCRIVNA